MNPIVFPGLGLEFNIQRVAFSVFGKDVYWYGIIITCGLILGVIYCYYQAHRFGILRDRVIDLILFAAPLSIIGARAYYVIFYQDLYRNADGSFNWGEAIAIWDGGLAIYGAIITAVIVLAVFCKVTKIKFLAFADLGVYGLFIGQSIGRWGNFCNQEAFGGLTGLPWRMGLTIGGTYMEVHPTFLYESLWNLLGFLIAHFLLRKRRKFDGQIFLFYLSWYGLGRMWIEGLRTDSLYLFGTGIRVSQLLAALCFLIAGSVLLVLSIKRKADPERLYVNQVRLSEEKAQSTEGMAEETAQAAEGEEDDSDGGSDS